MVNRTRVEGGGYSKHDIITSVEVLVFMFTGGVKFYTSVVFQKKKTAAVVACHIYSWFLSMWWVLSLSILFTPGIIPTFAR